MSWRNPLSQLGCGFSVGYGIIYRLRTQFEGGNDEIVFATGTLIIDESERNTILLSCPFISVRLPPQGRSSSNSLKVSGRTPYKDLSRRYCVAFTLGEKLVTREGKV